MSASLPLTNIRVVEMSHLIMGPCAGMFLGFLGAEVVKVEPPQGDKTRNLKGMGSGFYPTFNRGKKSVTLDLNAPDDLAKLHELLKTADVFVENFRDETLAKMGLAPSQLRETYPSLIVASCKGFLHGPYEHRAATDELVQMMTGMAYMTGPSGRPLRIGSSANDIMGGLFAAFGVLGALIARRDSNDGATIRAGLFENCLLLIAQHMVQYDIEGTESPPMPEREFSWPIYDLFKTSDDRLVFVGAATDGQWLNLCKGLCLEELLEDARLQTRPDQIEARSWTVPLVAQKISSEKFVDVIQVLEKHNVLYAPVSRPAEMYDDPHVNRPGGLLNSTFGEKTFRAPSLPLEINGLQVAPKTANVSSVGEHNSEILDQLDGNVMK